MTDCFPLREWPVMQTRAVSRLGSSAATAAGQLCRSTSASMVRDATNARARILRKLAAG